MLINLHSQKDFWLRAPTRVTEWSPLNRVGAPSSCRLLLFDATPNHGNHQNYSRSQERGEKGVNKILSTLLLRPTVYISVVGIGPPDWFGVVGETVSSVGPLSPSFTLHFQISLHSGYVYSRWSLWELIAFFFKICFSAFLLLVVAGLELEDRQNLIVSTYPSPHEIKDRFDGILAVLLD